MRRFYPLSLIESSYGMGGSCYWHRFAGMPVKRPASALSYPGIDKLQPLSTAARFLAFFPKLQGEEVWVTNPVDGVEAAVEHLLLALLLLSQQCVNHVDDPFLPGTHLVTQQSLKVSWQTSWATDPITCFGCASASTSASPPLFGSTTATAFFFFSEAPLCIFFFAFLRGVVHVSLWHVWCES